MEIRSKGVNARDKAFADAYNHAKNKEDLDFYSSMLDYSKKYGYQDLFIQRYKNISSEDREHIDDLIYNVDEDYKNQIAFEYMTLDLLDNIEKKEYEVIKYDENHNAILDETGEDYIKEKVMLTDREYAERTLNDIYKNSMKKLSQEFLLKQQSLYKNSLSWYDKFTYDISSLLTHVDTGIEEGVSGILDFFGGIGNAVYEGIANGKDGYREYYEKYALGRHARDTKIELQEFERLYTNFRDVYTGDYSSIWSKILLNSIDVVNNMIPFMLIPGSGVVNTIKGISYYASMYSTGMTDRFNDPNFASVSTLSIVFNGALKAGVEYTIERALGAILGRSTWMSERLGTNTARGTVKFLDKFLASQGKVATKVTDKINKIWSRHTRIGGKIIGDAFQEGVEEALQEISGILIDMMFDSKGKTFYKGGWNWQNVLDAAIIGAVVGGNMRAINIVATPRISTGNMKSIVDKKTGKTIFVEEKLSKSDTIHYNTQLQNLYNAYNVVIKNARKNKDYDTSSFWIAKAYESYSTLMSYFNGIGPERTANALAMLSEINEASEKNKALMSSRYISVLISSLGTASKENKLAMSSPEFIEKMRRAKVMSVTPVSQSAIENLTPEWRKILQERWKNNPDFKLMSTDGTDIVVSEDSKTILIPEKWFNEGALDVFKTVAEREVVNELYTELLQYEKPLLDMIVKEYREFSGDKNATIDRALYNLLYADPQNKQQFYSSFMYAHWNESKIWQIFSRLDSVAKSVLNKGNIQKALIKSTVEKIKKNMKNAIMDIVKTTNVRYDSLTVITEKEKQDIRMSDTRYRGTAIKDTRQQLSLDYDKLDEKSSKLPDEVRSMISDIKVVLENPNSSREQIQDALLSLYLINEGYPGLYNTDHYYFSMYVGNSTTSLPEEILSIINNMSPVSTSKEDMAINRQDILDAIHSITYEDGTPKYVAHYSEKGTLYVYKNIDKSQLLSKSLLDDPISFFSKGPIYVTDILSKSYLETLNPLNKFLFLKFIKNIPIKIVSNEELEGSLGRFHRGEDGSYIYINRNLYTENRKTEFINTICHETNHAFRKYLNAEGMSSRDISSKKLDEYISDHYKLLIDTYMKLAKFTNHPKISEKDAIKYAKYLLTEIEMNGHQTKQIMIYGLEGIDTFTSTGFIFGNNKLVTTNLDIYEYDKITNKNSIENDYINGLKQEMSLIDPNFKLNIQKRVNYDSLKSGDEIYLTKKYKDIPKGTVLTIKIEKEEYTTSSISSLFDKVHTKRSYYIAYQGKEIQIPEGYFDALSNKEINEKLSKSAQKTVEEVVEKPVEKVKDIKQEVKTETQPKVIPIANTSPKQNVATSKQVQSVNTFKPVKPKVYRKSAKENEYFYALRENQLEAHVENQYDIEFRNDVYEGLSSIIDSSVPTIYRSTARINDVILNYEKYLTSGIKSKIKNVYGSLNRQNVMKYLQKYFYDKYNGTVDLSFANTTREIVFINIRNFNEYSGSILQKATYDGIDNSLSTLVSSYEYKDESTGKVYKGVMPVSMLVSPDHNFGLIKVAKVKIKDVPSPYYSNGIIVLKTPKNNNDFRYQFAHEFQHLLDDANKLSGGLTKNFEVTLDMLKDFKEHMSEEFSKKNVDEQKRFIQNYIYHHSGERKAYGVTLLDADFVHVERSRGKFIAYMPWGSTYTLNVKGVKQEGRASVILYPTRRTVTKEESKHWLMNIFVRHKGDKGLAQTESLIQFIIHLSKEDFKKLDVRLQEMLSSGEMTSQNVLQYFKDAEDMNDFTFNYINKYFFGNAYINSMKDVDDVIDHLSDWHALYMTLSELGLAQKFEKEIITSQTLNAIYKTIQEDEGIKKIYDKFKNAFYTYELRVDNALKEMRPTVMIQMKGTLLGAYLVSGAYYERAAKLRKTGDPNDYANYLMRTGKMSRESTRKRAEELKEKYIKLDENYLSEHKKEVLADYTTFSIEDRAQFVADVYNNQSMYDALIKSSEDKLNFMFADAIQKLGYKQSLVKLISISEKKMGKYAGISEDFKKYENWEVDHQTDIEDELYQDLEKIDEDLLKDYTPTQDSYVTAIQLLGKRLYYATKNIKKMRDTLPYKIDDKNKTIKIDFDKMKSEGNFTLENLVQIRDDLAYHTRIAESILIERKSKKGVVTYPNIVSVYKNTDMPQTLKHILNRVTSNEEQVLRYTNVQGTDTVEYLKDTYKDFMDDNKDFLATMIQTPGEVENLIEYVASDKRLSLSGVERQRYNAYVIMTLAWIKNMNLEHSLNLDDYHLDLLDKIYNMIGHEWGQTGAALRTAVNLVSPTTYMLQELSDISGVKLEEEQLRPLIKAMRSGDNKIVIEEMNKLEKYIYDKGGDNKMTVLDMFFNLRSSFMLSSPGTWIRNIASNMVLRGSMRAASSIGTVLAETIFRKTKGIEQKYGLYKIQGTQPTDKVKQYSKSIFEGEIYELVKDSLNKYQYNETKGPYERKGKHGEITLDQNGEPVLNLNNTAYAHMIVETIKKRFYGATTYEKSMQANKVLGSKYLRRGSQIFGRMADKATTLLSKVLSDEKYIKARATYYFDRMLTESIENGKIDESDLKSGALTNQIATVLGNAFTEACADYMHKGSFLKDFENILYSKYVKAKSSSQKFAFGLGYSLWKAVLPYANAGWNWFREGIKYSPVGVIEGIHKLIHLESDINKDPNNKMLAFRAKQTLGKGVLGTTILGIGLALALAGVIGYDDDDNTIIVGDKKINISALFGSPAFTVGVIFGSKLGDEEVSVWKDLWNKFNEAIDISLDGFFLVDFIDALSYSQKGWTGAFSTGVENVLQSIIPNIWKTIVKMFSQYKYKTPTGFTGIMDRFFASLIPTYGDTRLEKRVDPYTGQYAKRWDIDWISQLASLTPIKIFRKSRSDVESYSIEHGVPKGEASAKFNDEGIGEWSYDYDEYNIYRGKLNNLYITEFMNDVTSYEIIRNDKKISLKASKMTDEEITKVLKRIYDKSSTYTKIWAWTQLGNKYYANKNEYAELKKLGINNIYLKSGKLSGFVKA